MKKTTKAIIYNSDKKCENCEWYMKVRETITVGITAGECNRFPPSIAVKGDEYIMFPLVLSSHK